MIKSQDSYCDWKPSHLQKEMCVRGAVLNKSDLRDMPTSSTHWYNAISYTDMIIWSKLYRFFPFYWLKPAKGIFPWTGQNRISEPSRPSTDMMQAGKIWLVVSSRTRVRSMNSDEHHLKWKWLRAREGGLMFDSGGGWQWTESDAGIRERAISSDLANVPLYQHWHRPALLPDDIIILR